MGLLHGHPIERQSNTISSFGRSLVKAERIFSVLPRAYSQQGLESPFERFRFFPSIPFLSVDSFHGI
jgi:hypothetical protein